MSKIIKVIDNETIEIRDCRCSATLYPEIPPTLQNIKDQIDHCEDWCVFKAIINPFQMYAENQEKDKEIERLKNIIDELEKCLKEGSFDVYFCSTSSQKTFKSNEIIIKAMMLDKLKALKEGE